VSSESSSGDAGVYRSRADDSAKLVCDRRRFGDLRPFKRPYLPPQISLSPAASFTKIQINPRLGSTRVPSDPGRKRFLVPCEKSRMRHAREAASSSYYLEARPTVIKDDSRSGQVEEDSSRSFGRSTSQASHLARSIEIRSIPAAIERHI